MNSRKAKRGSVIPLILFIVILLMIIGVGVLGLGYHGIMMAVRSGSDIAARCAADAAISHAIYQMNEKLKIKPWDDTSLPAVTNNALLGSDATYNYAVSNIGGNYVIQATGRSGQSARNVEGVLRIQSVFDYALFAKDTIELKNSATVDWINNEPNDWPLQIGTNSINDGAIILKNSTTVNGDIVVGVGGNPETVIKDKSGVNVTGSAYSMFSRAVLPTITVPAGLATLGGDITESNSPLNASGKYTSITLAKSKELIINEPVVLYITGDITLKNDAKISIGSTSDTDNDASLTIYLGGKLVGDNSAGFNNFTQDAKRFTLYGLDSCVDIRLKNGDVFYGSIYAPNAYIDLDNSAAAYGSIVGQSLLLRNGAYFYYDAALRDRTLNDDAVRFAIQRWTEP